MCRKAPELVFVPRYSSWYTRAAPRYSSARHASSYYACTRQVRFFVVAQAAGLPARTRRWHRASVRGGTHIRLVPRARPSAVLRPPRKLRQLPLRQFVPAPLFRTNNVEKKKGSVIADGASIEKPTMGRCAATYKPQLPRPHACPATAPIRLATAALPARPRRRRRCAVSSGPFNTLPKPHLVSR